MSATREAVRFAFVGCGSIARHHLKALQASSHQSKVCAAVDTREENATRFAQGLQDCQVFTSLSDCLNWGQFDAAVVMVPHHLHEVCATDCLKANKHVLLEKPLAHNVDSCSRLIKVAEHTDAVFIVGEQSPHWPEVVKAKQLIETGVIGRPYFAKANYWESVNNAFLEDLDKHFKEEDSWRFDPDKVGGGCLMDGATHWVRPLRTWFGDVSEAVGVVGHPLEGCGGESLASVLLKFKSGLTASLYCHFMDIPMHTLPFFQIFGDKGEITIDGSFEGGMSVRTKDDPKGQRFDSLGGYNKGFAPQMNAFLTAIATGQRGVASCHDALGEVLVANAVYKSLRSNRWEKTTLENLID